MAASAGGTVKRVEPEGHTIRGHPSVPGGPTKEEVLLEHVKKTAPAGDAQAVLNAIDKYAWSGSWYMNIGDVKGKILDAAVDKADPTVAVELGAYCGYSGIRIASRLAKLGARLFSVEFHEPNARVATRMAEHAGVADKITMLVGTIQTQTQALRDHGVSKIDLLFIDHDKSIYLRDLRYLIAEGLVQPGTVVVGDNVVNPGAPDFLAFVMSGPAFTTEKHDAFVEYSKEPDMVTVSTYNGGAS